MQSSLFVVFLLFFTLISRTDQASIALNSTLLPSTPLKLRGLWAIIQLDTETSLSTQVGQAFFYNNETFTWNFLDNPSLTWINQFVEIKQIDSDDTYRVFTRTIKGPSESINQTLCSSLHRLFSGDFIWRSSSQTICKSLSHTEESQQTMHYVRNERRWRLIDDEGDHEFLSNTPYESTLISFDQALPHQNRKAVVFYGASSIRRWSTLNVDFPDVSNGVINRGFGGSTLKDCTRQFKRIILPLEPQLLIIHAGENDFAHGLNSKDITKLFVEFVETVRRFFPTMFIAFISMRPGLNDNDLFERKEINEQIHSVINTMPNVDFINIFDAMLSADGKIQPELYAEDQIHINEKGYAIWKQIVTDYLKNKTLVTESVMESNDAVFFLKVLIAFEMYLLWRLFPGRVFRKRLRRFLCRFNSYFFEL